MKKVGPDFSEIHGECHIVLVRKLLAGNNLLCSSCSMDVEKHPYRPGLLKVQAARVSVIPTARRSIPKIQSLPSTAPCNDSSCHDSADRPSLQACTKAAPMLCSISLIVRVLYLWAMKDAYLSRARRYLVVVKGPYVLVQYPETGTRYTYLVTDNPGRASWSRSTCVRAPDLDEMY